MNDLLKPVDLFGNLCPRTDYNRPRQPRCAKPLTDFKCPVHGLIREVAPS